MAGFRQSRYGPDGFAFPDLKCGQYNFVAVATKSEIRGTCRFLLTADKTGQECVVFVLFFFFWFFLFFFAEGSVYFDCFDARGSKLQWRNRGVRFWVGRCLSRCLSSCFCVTPRLWLAWSKVKIGRSHQARHALQVDRHRLRMTSRGLCRHACTTTRTTRSRCKTSVVDLMIFVAHRLRRRTQSLSPPTPLFLKKFSLLFPFDVRTHAGRQFTGCTNL